MSTFNSYSLQFIGLLKGKDVYLIDHQNIEIYNLAAILYNQQLTVIGVFHDQYILSFDKEYIEEINKIDLDIQMLESNKEIHQYLNLFELY